MSPILWRWIVICGSRQLGHEAAVTGSERVPRACRMVAVVDVHTETVCMIAPARECLRLADGLLNLLHDLVGQSVELGLIIPRA